MGFEYFPQSRPVKPFLFDYSFQSLSNSPSFSPSKSILLLFVCLRLSSLIWLSRLSSSQYTLFFLLFSLPPCLYLSSSSVYSLFVFSPTGIMIPILLSSHRHCISLDWSTRSSATNEPVPKRGRYSQGNEEWRGKVGNGSGGG